ncbi:class I SAM-dependent methyltransferase [Candidatus Gracilibacteria bacterium]|nr:class I SAM-dependent methyltransferase [Candidatus Gracilibacteria bacterium]NUJ99448.1 class I SAM-dependent methyltransferase [Candidatus Gracilibacteria bacterium]
MLDYNNFAKTFSASRKNMKWEEIEYFIQYLLKNGDIEDKRILDVGCGNGRLLGELKKYFEIKGENYLGIDLSEELLKEAKSFFPGYNFLVSNMLDVKELKNEKVDIIFFIASFHHLDSFEKRKNVLLEVSKLLTENGIIFMTNWDLQSPLNTEKYQKSEILGTENEFGSKDFSIKIGKYQRFYHSFSLLELEKLFTETGFFIEENRLFENERNIISIIKKK